MAASAVGWHRNRTRTARVGVRAPVTVAGSESESGGSGPGARDDTDGVALAELLTKMPYSLAGELLGSQLERAQLSAEGAGEIAASAESQCHGRRSSEPGRTRRDRDRL